MTRPNYVQVTDTRGTWDGWTLTVAESDQFQNTSGEKLTGAELSFSKGYTDGTTAAKPVISITLILLLVQLLAKF